MCDVTNPLLSKEAARLREIFGAAENAKEEKASWVAFLKYLKENDQVSRFD